MGERVTEIATARPAGQLAMGIFKHHQQSDSVFMIYSRQQTLTMIYWQLAFVFEKGEDSRQKKTPFFQ